ncbi:MAG TPA: pyruvate kinase alpha/beta domain-containing protein, partial [Acidimicrobiia bacterium]|nr:pyruvate kinase alpha/beta domain-containing protein [Acidimicrobiia bacterium]
ARQLSIAWGVTPLLIAEYRTTDDIVWFAVKAAADLGLVKTDDVVAVVVGTLDEPQPATDVLRLVRIH